MKTLVINGSPKGERSNSLQLTRAFLEGAGLEAAETIHAAKADIKPCLGCFGCWNKTPGRCVIEDSMAEILPQIIAADVVLWSFPLYYFGVPGALKNLIDRQLPLNLPAMECDSESGGHPLRYDLSRQLHVIVSSCGFWTADGNYDSVTAMFDHFHGKGGYAAILCGQGELFRVDEARQFTDSYLEVVRRAGSEFSGGGIRQETMEALSRTILPREIFEQRANASW